MRCMLICSLHSCSLSVLLFLLFSATASLCFCHPHLLLNHCLHTTMIARLQLFHQVVDESIGHAYSYDSFLSTASKSSLSPLQLRTTVDALKAFIAQLLRTSPVAAGTADAKPDNDWLNAQTKALGVNDTVAAALYSAYLARERELIAHAKRTAVTQLSEWSLRDYDWSARVTIASSSISNLQTPLLLLTLTLAQPNGTTKEVQLELDEAGLERLLTQMDKLNTAVQQYSTTTAGANAATI